MHNGNTLVEIPADLDLAKIDWKSEFIDLIEYLTISQVQSFLQQEVESNPGMTASQLHHKLQEEMDKSERGLKDGADDEPSATVWYVSRVALNELQQNMALKRQLVDEALAEQPE